MRGANHRHRHRAIDSSIEIEEGEEGMLLWTARHFMPKWAGRSATRAKSAKAAHLFQVEDCVSPFPGVIAHLGTAANGLLAKRAITSKRHRSMSRGARASRTTTPPPTCCIGRCSKSLGPHIKQAGSLVDEKHLRFDFSHHKQMSAARAAASGKSRQRKDPRRSARPVHEMTFEEAQKHPEIKQFFGEKYGDKVRVVDIDYSKELCGGTHTEPRGHDRPFQNRQRKQHRRRRAPHRSRHWTARPKNMCSKKKICCSKSPSALKTPPGAVAEKLEHLARRK